MNPEREADEAHEGRTVDEPGIKWRHFECGYDPESPETFVCRSWTVDEVARAILGMSPQERAQIAAALNETTEPSS